MLSIWCVECSAEFSTNGKQEERSLTFVGVTDSPLDVPDSKTIAERVLNTLKAKLLTIQGIHLLSECDAETCHLVMNFTKLSKPTTS